MDTKFWYVITKTIPVTIMSIMSYIVIYNMLTFQQFYRSYQTFPGQNFADDTFICNFMNEKFYVLIQISVKLVPKGLIDI